MISEDGISLKEIINEFIIQNPKRMIDDNETENLINNIFKEYELLLIKKKKKEEKISKYNEIYDSIEGIPIIGPDLSYLKILVDDDDILFIAKMIYHCQDCYNFIPRKIQIISLLYFINKSKNEGIIQQINTGEGKSIIIAFLAVYIAKKRNKKIDILTSSPILAQRDANNFNEFYKKCGLSVDYISPHNNENYKTLFSSENYSCYNSDILYGDTLCLEGDFLRTHFMGVKGRGFKRKFECIIIDEIDNIALDNLKNTTELLDTFHGYKFLEYVYLFIYKTLTEIEKEEKKKNIIEEKEKIVKLLYNISLKEFNDIEKLRDEKKILIPKHLKQYILDRLNDWCESAFIAKYIFKNNENYIIKKSEDQDYNFDVICPIDFYNTGVTQQNSVWSGLHQFLQIKEGKILTEENLSTCYISNLSFFNKYITRDNNGEIIENNIYGLTGTVGSKYNITTLDELYKLKVLFIPPFKKSKLKIDVPIIVSPLENNNDSQNKKGTKNIDSEWRNEIIKKTFKLINSGRSVLLIYQYISEVEKIYDKMKGLKETEDWKIIKYSRSDKKEEKKFLESEIEPRTLIISTNISGRGTDIKISRQLVKNGGLHVILTYEPFNERIERQAFGRAARRGQNGSAGKIIICPFTAQEIIKKREEREKEESEFLINVYKFKIESFENIFNKFSSYLENIYTNYNIQKSLKSIKDEEDPQKKDEQILLLDIKERWGLFLINNNLNKKEKEYRKKYDKIDSSMFKNIEKNYEIFEEKLRQYSLSSFLCKKNDNKNKIDYEFINALYLNKSLKETRIDMAINTDKYFSIGSYMFRLRNSFQKLLKLLSHQKENNNNKNTEVVKICNEIELDFRKLDEILKDFVNHYENLKQLSHELCDASSDFITKSNTKYKVINSIYKLMEQNKTKFDKFNADKNIELKFKPISFKNFISKEIQINSLDLEYFMDFGFRLFILKIQGDSNCIIY